MDVEANLNIEMMVDSDWLDYDLLPSHWLKHGQYLSMGAHMNNHLYSAALPSPQDTRLS